MRGLALIYVIRDIPGVRQFEIISGKFGENTCAVSHRSWLR